MPRPRTLTGPQVAAAALAVADREGLPAVTMRSVARELGVGTMSVYRYVEGRDALEDLIVDLVLADVDTEVDPSAGWRPAVEALAERARAAVARHPAVVPLLLTRRQSAAGTRRWGEAALAQLTRAGFDGRRRVLAFRALLAYVLGAVQVEHLGALSGPGTAAIAALPTDEFPLLAATATAARDIGPDEEFHAGLTALLDGLERSAGG